MASFVRFNEDLVIDANGIVPEATAKELPDADPVAPRRDGAGRWCELKAIAEHEQVAISAAHERVSTAVQRIRLDALRERGRRLAPGPRLQHSRGLESTPP